MKKDLFSIFPIFLFLYSLLILIELYIPIYSYNEMWNAIVVFMDLFFPLRLAFKIQKEFLKIVLENRTFMDSYDAFSPYPCIEPFIHSFIQSTIQLGSQAAWQSVSSVSHLNSPLLGDYDIAWMMSCRYVISRDLVLFMETIIYVYSIFDIPWLDLSIKTLFKPHNLLPDVNILMFSNSKQW